MHIYFKAEEHCDYFLFFESSETPLVRLPENILLSDLLVLIQSSLDQIKPVILLGDVPGENEIDLSILKSFHFKSMDHKFIFLNYSIRNSLSKFTQKDFPVKSFNEIESFLAQSFTK